MPLKLPLLLLLLALLGSTPCSGAPGLKVFAGSHDRNHTIISLKLPSTLTNANTLQDPDNKCIPLQVDSSGNATFVVANLPRNTSRTYQILSLAVPPQAQTQVSTAPTQVKLEANGLPPLIYQSAPGTLPRPDIAPAYLRGGYLHPILTPKGVRISDDYAHNHLHHHGIWFSWTKTSFRGDHPDFWNMGQESGTVEFAGLDRTWNGPVHAGLESRHHFRELKSKQREIVLNETWKITYYRKLDTPQPVTLFDMESRQICATDQPLELPEYHYGGMGFRGHGSWDGKDNTLWLTSEGITDRVEGHATRSRWCYVGGLVDGQQAGIAILCHPKNYRFPQPMRIHPTEPFFCYAPQQLGPMQISPGKPYLSQYRLVAFDGPPQAKFIDGLFQDYASPPRTELLLP